MSTIGVDFKIRTIDFENKKVKLQIWDTAGNNRFHQITNAYYRGAHGIIIAYNITKRKSFEDIAVQMRKIDENTKNGPSPFKILIGTCSDLESQREVTVEEGRELAKSYGIPFYEVSSKNNVNVNETFEHLVRDIKTSFENLDW